mmetsp:Transcript_67230/g.156062  ORF Transcript_67230/g.156062 Transcript_67230/m.156062 type:complete len:223 (+) Transcript_67230:111-779(+)
MPVQRTSMSSSELPSLTGMVQKSAPVHSCAKWMALRVCSVSGPVRKADTPAAKAMKMMTWSAQCLSKQAPRAMSARRLAHASSASDSASPPLPQCMALPFSTQPVVVVAVMETLRKVEGCALSGAAGATLSSTSTLQAECIRFAASRQTCRASSSGSLQNSTLTTTSARRPGSSSCTGNNCCKGRQLRFTTPPPAGNRPRTTTSRVTSTPKCLRFGNVTSRR